MSVAKIDPRTLENAVRLAELGWRVQPGFHVIDGKCQCTWGSCSHPGKHPRLGPDRKTVPPTADPDMIRGYFTEWPYASLRIVTGGSARLLGVDLDPRNGGDLAALQKLISEPLPDTVEVETGGGGRHLYFRASSKLAEGLPHKAEPVPGVELCFGQGLTAPPSIHASGREYRWVQGRAPWERELAEAPEELLRLALKEATKGAPITGGRVAGPPAEGTEIPKGRRRRTLLALGASLRARGVTLSTIETTLELEHEQRCTTLWGEAERRRKMRGILRTLARYRGPVVNPDSAVQTDVGRAKRFAEIFGGDVRWCGGRGAWYAFDGTTWVRDDARRADAYAKELARIELAEAAAGAYVRGEDGEDALKKAIARAVASFSGPRIRAVVDLARSEPGIPVSPDAFDSDPYLLNTPHGTIDLRTKRVREHDPGDLITMVTGAPFEPDATWPEWDAVLEHALPDPEVRDYFMRLCGSFLEGKAVDDVVPTIHGPTGTSKSTILRAVMSAMGTYATSSQYSTFSATEKRAGRATPELVRLIGRRAVFAFESGEGVRLDAERVKLLASGDPSTARALYGAEEEMHGRFKVVLVSNFRPIVDGDPAIWRRLREVPFIRQVESPDTTLRDRLQEHPAAREGVLAWMVRGYIAYKARGLDQPAAVTAATNEFRHEADPFEQFLDAECVLGDGSTLKKAIEERYNAWAERAEVTPLEWKDVRRRLKDRGCKAYHDRAGGAWRGIRLRSDAEQADAFVEEVRGEA